MYLGWSWRGRPLDVFAMEAMSLSDQRHDAHGARRGLESAVSLAVAGGDDMTVIGRGGKSHRARLRRDMGKPRPVFSFCALMQPPRSPAFQ